ncbi:hypothetical protein [Sphingobacterium sp. MYb382]|uniref:hypothetical protein n=1 Tax=Sphingobacterium sp. MYb382 TaxID=2745278 RepID=UPI0030AAFC04
MWYLILALFFGQPTTTNSAGGPPPPPPPPPTDVPGTPGDGGNEGVIPPPKK